VHCAEITIFKLQPSPVPRIFFGWDDTLPGQRQLKNLNRRIKHRTYRHRAVSLQTKITTHF